jgi:hypothetical protein
MAQKTNIKEQGGCHLTALLAKEEDEDYQMNGSVGVSIEIRVGGDHNSEQIMF